MVSTGDVPGTAEGSRSRELRTLINEYEVCCVRTCVIPSVMIVAMCSDVEVPNGPVTGHQS